MNPLHLAAWAAALLLSSSLFAHTVALRLLLLLAGLGLVAVAIAKDRRALRLLPPLWIPLLLWAAWAVASLMWSIDPERTAKELRNEIGYSIGVFWLCFVAAQARGSARAFLPVLGAAGVLLCANAIYVAAPGAEGWFGGPGNLSSALLILIPCASAAAWYGWHAAWPAVWRAAPIIVLVGSLAAGYSAQSRTFWVALSAQVACTALLLFAQRAKVASRRAASGLLAAAVVLGAAAMTLHVQSEREALGAHVIEEDPRLRLWQEVSERIEARPWTGYGFGRGMLRVDLKNELGKPQLWHAHNLFMDTALQLGVPGVVLLFALLAAIFRQGWRLARDPSPRAAACGIALLAVLVGMLVRNMTDVLLIRQNALLFWGVLGALLALGMLPRQDTR
jgi:O-antigen ligase